jgi:outer membrane protein, multidrug efflux system
MIRTTTFVFLAAAVLHAGPVPSAPKSAKKKSEATARYEPAPKYKAAASASPRLPERESWWSMFGDARLNRMIAEVETANLDAEAALARVEQARAATGIARAEFFPTIRLNFSTIRARNSATQRVAGFPGPIPSATITTNTLAADFGYELDVWGRIRKNVEAAKADADASLATHDTLVLSLRAEVASTWFALRTLDTQRGILRETIGLRREALDLAKQRMDAGIGTDFDLSRAEAELATAEADLATLAQRRPALENGLAVLLGKDPSRFRVGEDLAWASKAGIPAIPPGIPAQLISRRPDVAAAERQLAAATSRIGVARAEFLPTIRLTGQIGLLTGDRREFFEDESRTWSFGPTVSLPVFEGGRLHENLKAAKAVQKEATAQYQQTVLTATADVETALGALRALVRRNEAQSRAESATTRGAKIARDRYKAGTSTYLEVIDAERGALSAQLTTAALTGERLATTVQLVKALGGGWGGGAAQTSNVRRPTSNDQ